MKWRERVLGIDKNRSFTFPSQTLVILDFAWIIMKYRQGAAPFRPISVCEGDMLYLRVPVRKFWTETNRFQNGHRFFKEILDFWNIFSLWSSCQELWVVTEHGMQIWSDFNFLHKLDGRSSRPLTELKRKWLIMIRTNQSSVSLMEWHTPFCSL